MKAQRIFAYIIDAILIGILSSIVCFVSGFSIQTLVAAGGLAIFYNPVSIVALIVSAVYFLTDGMSGGSPGKKVLGLMVTPSLQKDRFSNAVTRALVKVLTIHLIVGVILFLIERDGGSSLHDKVAGTRVQKAIPVT